MVETVTLDVNAGDYYCFIIDGYAGAEAAYTIEVTCDQEP